MKIAGSSIDFASQHASQSSTVRTEQLRAWTGNTRPDFEGRGQSAAAQTAAVQVTISSASLQAQATDAASASAATDGTSSGSGDANLDMLRSIVEMLVGHKLKLFGDRPMPASAGATSADSSAAAGTGAPQRAGFGIEYDAHEQVSEAEQTNFQASGSIRTADGKSIDFNVELQMSRSFSASRDVSIRAGDGVRKDPLVINFAGNAAQLQSTRFAFDIEGNGEKVDIATLGQGSAYVALDLNHNGKVDSGNELFGTKSGNGFADLATYDSDKNNWIDENDAVYSRLLVWSKDATGNDILSTLAQRKVGALYLGNIATPFDLKNPENTLQGQVRSSGIYLNEDGSVGTLQQVDLVV